MLCALLIRMLPETVFCCECCQAGLVDDLIDDSVNYRLKVPCSKSHWTTKKFELIKFYLEPV